MNPCQIKHQLYIDNQNFINHVDNIISQIQNAEFISIDCQFSGLDLSQQDKVSQYQTLEQYYIKIKQKVINFCLFQVGLSIFKFEDNKYVPICYNFYIRQNESTPKKIRLILSTFDTMQFLSKKDMDFHKIFLKGIQSTRLSQKDKKQTIMKDHKYYLYNYNMRKNFDSQVEKIEQIVIKEKKQLIIDLGYMNNYVKLYNLFKQKVKFTKIKQDKHQYLIKIQQNIKQQSKQKQAQPLGFSKIIQAIIDFKIPLVGYSVLQDIAYLSQNFIQQLPDTVQQFQKLWEFTSIFQVFNIRKHCYTQQLSSIGYKLQNLYEACLDGNFLNKYVNINHKNVQQYRKSNRFHEAAYDAYMAGCVFIGLMNLSNNSIQTKLKLQNISRRQHCFWRQNKSTKNVLIIEENKDDKIQIICEFLRQFGDIQMKKSDRTYVTFLKDQDINKIIQKANANKFNLQPYSRKFLTIKRFH